MGIRRAGRPASRAGTGARGAVAAAALVFAIALLAAGCGGGSETRPDDGAGPRIGVPLRLADCTDWNQADVAERLGTLSQLDSFAGGPVAGTGGTGPVLAEKRAYDLFQGYCEPRFARSFKLYKLYGRAAAFAAYAEQAQGG